MVSVNSGLTDIGMLQLPAYSGLSLELLEICK